MLSSLLLPLTLIGACRAEVTIYTTIPGLNAAPATTTTALIPYTTGNSAYSQLVLTPPTPPTGLNATWPVTIQPANTVANLSMPQKGNFMGFSVELSVVSQVLGLNSTILQIPFLYYLANIKERAGQGPVVRVGGNTQDESTMYNHTFLDKWGHQQIVQKFTPIVDGNPTLTPNIDFALELFYTMGNITGLVGTDWYFGLQFDQPTNNSNAMWVAQEIEDILGDHLVSLQVGNEPDLYANHGRRPANYSIQDYFSEFQEYMVSLNASTAPAKKIVLGPSVCCTWTTDQVFAAGYLTTFSQNLNTVGLMHYPNNNCAIGGALNPQDELAAYLSHAYAQSFVAMYVNVISESQAASLPIVMLETNTASCGGFPGISDAFAAPLWAIDNALLMAANNFTNMLIHIGGQSDSYNPFTPPPTNISATHGWTTGAIYYALLAVAETIGPSNSSRLVDLGLSSTYRPGYAIYENGTPVRVALINYASDTTGASDYNAVISLAGTTVPQQVYVKYLLAPSVTDKFNITWAGQTMGKGIFQSDGRLSGGVNVTTIQCDTANNQCIVPMQAPSFALVFLTQDALNNATPTGSSTLTFPTTVYTNKHGQTAAINPSVLATMNGSGGPANQLYLGSTGKGSALTGASLRKAFSPALWSLCAVLVGCIFVMLR